MPVKSVIFENYLLLPKSAAKAAAAFLVLTTLPITPANDVGRVRQAKFFSEQEVFTQPQRSNLVTSLTTYSVVNPAIDVRRKAQDKTFVEADTFLRTQPSFYVTTLASATAPIYNLPFRRTTVTVENVSIVRAQRGTPAVLAQTPTVLQSSDIFVGQDTYGWPPDPESYFNPTQHGTPGVINGFTAYNPATDSSRSVQAKVFGEADTFLLQQRIGPLLVNPFVYNAGADVTARIRQARVFSEADTFVRNAPAQSGAINFKPYVPATDVRRAQQAKWFQDADTFLSRWPFSQILINGTAIPPPPAPTNLVAVGGILQALLTWTPSLGATSYNVYQGLSSGGETLLATGVPLPAYVSLGLTSGIVYYFKVRAQNAQGQSGFSNEASCIPVAGPIKVMAVTTGWYADQQYQPGDVFLINPLDFSDSSVNYQAASGGVGYGWMKHVAAGTPLSVAQQSAGTPFMPVVDPNRRFVY